MPESLVTEQPSSDGHRDREVEDPCKNASVNGYLPGIHRSKGSKTKATEKNSVLDRILGTCTRLQGRKDKDQSPRSNDVRKILFLCLLIILPMASFTAITIWLIFAHRIDDLQCPYQDLCLTSSSLNQSFTSADYIVDFSAAKLVFIASWSSTVSFTLIGVLMAMYAYTVARQWSQQPNTCPQQLPPTPYQTSLLFRAINAEYQLLLDMAVRKIQDVFWKATKADKMSRTPSILHWGVVIFTLSICGSLFIQASDTYLHIATKAIDFNQIRAEPTESYAFGRDLASSCLDRKTEGSENSNYWSCALTFAADGITLTNNSENHAVFLGISPYHGILEAFDDQNGIHMAVLGPYDPNPNLDWVASSFGVSIQCRAIRNDLCVWNSSLTLDLEHSVPFNCTVDRAGVDVSGNITPYLYTLYYFDWNRYVPILPSVQNPEHIIGARMMAEMRNSAANLSDEEGGSVFKNPWDSLNIVTVGDSDKNRFFLEQDPSHSIWGVDSGSWAYMFLQCTNTVWDVSYKSVNANVTITDRRKSNSSVAGIVSMPNYPAWNYNQIWHNVAVEELTYYGVSAEQAIRAYEGALRRGYVSILAGQSSPRPAQQVQSRRIKVVSRVPKAPVWILVSANVIFLLLGLVLAAFAISATIQSPIVAQVQLRLSIMGLSAHLFEQSYAGRKVKDDEELFEERHGEKDRMVKRVAIEETATGGATFVTSERWE